MSISFNKRKKKICFQDVEHEGVLSVGIVIDGVDRILDLRLNTDLIPEQYKHTIQVKGKRITEKPTYMVIVIINLIIFN